MTPISKRQRVRYYIYIKLKNCKTFMYKKSPTFRKKQDNFNYVFIHKKPYTLLCAIFMKTKMLAFTYKKHDNLRYVTFLYAISQTLQKSKIISVTFFNIQKSEHFALRNFSWNF